MIQTYQFVSREGTTMIVTINGSATPWIWEVA